MRRSLALAFLISSVLGQISVTHAQHGTMSDEQLMQQLKGAAPKDILDNATILNMASDGKMKVIKEGTNGWTCMDPGGEPMCADKAGMEWMQAWQDKASAPQKLGFIYMLRGDSGSSNTDPYATTKTPNNNWVETGPHVMIVGAEAKSMMQGYPRDANPNPNVPYVMWPGTPYEHLMLPIQ